MESSRRKPSDDEVIRAWPWLGGKPGRAARRLFAIWVSLLVLMAVLIILAFVTTQICLAVVLIIVTAMIGTIPSLFLIGSRI